MLTSDLYWRDTGPPYRWNEAKQRQPVAVLRIIRPWSIYNIILARIVRFRDPEYLRYVYQVEFANEIEELRKLDSPVFTAEEEAKAYAHMTCLLILKEN